MTLKAAEPSGAGAGSRRPTTGIKEVPAANRVGISGTRSHIWAPAAFGAARLVVRLPSDDHDQYTESNVLQCAGAPDYDLLGQAGL